MQWKKSTKILLYCVGIILIFTLLPLASSGSDSSTPSSTPPTVSITAPTPLSISPTSNFSIHVTLNFSEPVRIKAALLNLDGKHSAQFWNGTKWVYPGGSWNSMPVVQSNNSGIFHLLPKESYSGWPGLLNSSFATIEVTVRPLNSSKNTRERITVEIFHLPDPPPPPPPIKGTDHMMITEVYYNTHHGGSEEYVVLTNQANHSVNISGWTLTDGEHTFCFDADTIKPIEQLTMEPSENLILVRNPEVHLGLTGNSVNHTLFLSLENKKDSVSLLDPNGTVIDAVAWGGEEVVGFNGGVEAYTEGRVLKRNRVGGEQEDREGKWNEGGGGEVLKHWNRGVGEDGGEFVDTNAPVDWESQRIYIVGQSEIPFRTVTIEDDSSVSMITTFVSPDCSYAVINRTLANSTSTIELNMYELTNPGLYIALRDAAERGVQVSIFLEGSPVGGVSDTELHICSLLSEAGAHIRFIHSNKTVKDRYAYDHAKYCIIDGRTLIIDSENWKSSGIPIDPTYGNRGWGVVIENPEVAGFFHEAFSLDSNPIMFDVVPFSIPPFVAPENISLPDSIMTSTYTPVFGERTIHGPMTITPVFAPDHTLREDAIIGMIDSAKKSVYIEQLQCPIMWDESTPNAYLEAAIRAAKRGCEVKVLLDSRYVDLTDTRSDNFDTVRYLNDVAREHNLTNLQAKLIVLKGINKLHNKGVIVDGELTLVSSINWGKGAVFLNREAGVIIGNHEVAGYFTGVFLSDWNLKERPVKIIPVSSEGTPLSQFFISAIAIILGCGLGMCTRPSRSSK